MSQCRLVRHPRLAPHQGVRVVPPPRPWQPQPQALVSAPHARYHALASRCWDQIFFTPLFILAQCTTELSCKLVRLGWLGLMRGICSVCSRRWRRTSLPHTFLNSTCMDFVRPQKPTRSLAAANCVVRGANPMVHQAKSSKNRFHSGM